jgi:flagellar basal-body rod modification protein FlgD
MSTVDTISAINGSTAGDVQQYTRTTSTLVGQQFTEFLTILMAQMSHQDPLNPMDNQEMVSQLAQLNSLQELQAIRSEITAMNKASEFSYASSLIGKSVIALTADSTIEGVVTGFYTGTDGIMLRIGDESVAIASVSEVNQGEIDG